MATMMWMFLWLGFKLSNCDPLNLSCSFELDLCGWSSSGSDLWLRQNSSSTSDPQGTGPDGANEGIFYIVAEASGSNTSIKSYSLSSSSFSSVADWQFTFAYHMFGSGELVLQGWSQDTWATLWQIVGDHGAAWHKVDVNIGSSASQLRFVADTSLGDIALDAFEIGFIVLSGPCTSTAGCVQSPQFPGNYGNSELCEVAAPAKPLNVTHFATEANYDFLTIGGVEYSGLSGPQQGAAIVTSEIIQWRSDGSMVSDGWQICIASELTTLILISGPCTVTAGCAQSPNFPNNYSNSELCEIVAPDQKLYFTRFETENELDVLTIDGQAYSGSSGPPQGSTSSGIILWSTSADTTAGGWQMCTANGVTANGLNFLKKNFTASHAHPQPSWMAIANLHGLRLNDLPPDHPMTREDPGGRQMS